VKPHRFDPVSFAFGLLFLVTGGVLLSGEIDLADLSGRGILVLPVLFGGVLLVAVGIRRLLGDRVAALSDHGSDAEADAATDTQPLDS
jgi:uncharacterized membrane protein YgdD (TMEM256/DUF423 family)